MSGGYAICRHVEEGECCFRRKGAFREPLCDILCDATFEDGVCHFRKKSRYGKNLYDTRRKKMDDKKRDADSLWIGVQSINEKSITALNVFRKVGSSFELVKTLEGDNALLVYEALTKDGDETNDVELNLQV